MKQFPHGRKLLFIVNTLYTIYFMDIISIVIGFVLGAVIALGAYILIRRSILKGKHDEIIEKAKLEAEKIKSERILQAKEKFLNL